MIAIEKERKKEAGREEERVQEGGMCVYVCVCMCASYPEDEADQASSGRELRRSRGKGVSLFKERSR